MSGGHAPGPWKATSIPQEADGHWVVQENGDWCIHASGSPWQVAYLKAQSISSFPTEANARRIVDCVNACEGIADPSAVPELVAALQFLADSARATTGFSSPMALADADKLLAKIGGDA